MGIFFTDSGSFNDLTITGSMIVSGNMSLSQGVNLSGTSSWAVSASWSPMANSSIPAGTVSSSTQFKTLTDPFTGSFTGSFNGDGTNITGITATAAPAGPNKAVQFNDAGATSGSSNFLFDKSLNSIVVTGSISVSGSLSASNNIYFRYPSNYDPYIMGPGYANGPWGNDVNIGRGNLPGVATDGTDHVRWNVAIGQSNFSRMYIGQHNIGIGYGNGYDITGDYGNNNIILGNNNINAAYTTVDHNIIIGQGIFNRNYRPQYNVAIGHYAGGSQIPAGTYDQTGSILLGYYAGAYTTSSNTFIINSIDRGSIDGDRTGSLIYGVFDKNPALQTLIINANVSASSFTGSFKGDGTGITGVSATPPAGTVSSSTQVLAHINNVDITPSTVNSLRITTSSMYGASNNALFIDALTRGNTGAEQSESLFYGVMNATANLQTLRFNANVTIPYLLNGINIGQGVGNTTSNTAVGFGPLINNTTGIQNTALGYYSLNENITGSQNVAIGNEALRRNTHGIDNTAIGSVALNNNTVGSYNVAVGSDSLFSLTSGSSNISIGSHAGYHEVTSNNQFFVDGFGSRGTAILDRSGSLIYGVMSPTATSQTIQMNAQVKAFGYTGSLLGTASNAVSASWAPGGNASVPAGTVSSSAQFITLTDPFTGSFTGSFKGDGSALTGLAGFPYIGVAGISGSLLVSGSTIMGDGKSKLDTSNPEVLLVSSSGTTVNTVFAYANLNNYSQINIKNVNAGNSASSDIVATANDGTETSNYIDMGINSSGHVANIPNAVGTAGDGYVYLTSSVGELYFGNASSGAKSNVRLFSGGITADSHTRIFISSSGDIGMNTITPLGRLHVSGGILQEDIIIATTNINDDTEISVRSYSAGNSASVGFTAENNLYNGTTGFVRMGMNSSVYSKVGSAPGGASDAYLFMTSSTGELHLGHAAGGSNSNVRIFTGGMSSDALTRIFVSSSGDIGIGTVTPKAKLHVNGPISSSGFTGSATLYNATSPTTGSINATGGQTINLNITNNNVFVVGATGAGTVTWTLTNVAPTGIAHSFLIQYTNGGTLTNTWPTGTKWPGGTAPTLTSAGVDLIGFVTVDGGTTYRATLLQRDSK